MVAQRVAGGAPGVEHPGVVGGPGQLAGVDEAERLGHAVLLEGLQVRFGDGQARHARRQQAVGGQVIDGDGNVETLGAGGAGEQQGRGQGGQQWS